MRLYVKDHPEANGRMAQRGEHGYTLKFPLASGETLEVMCGEETLNHFRDFLGSMALDDAEVHFIVDGGNNESSTERKVPE